MKATEIMVRIDKITKDILIILLDATANTGNLPYITLNGPLDEISLEYYSKHTKKASVAAINEAVEHIKKRYGCGKVLVRYRLPANFRDRLWPEWSKNKTA